MEAIRPKQTDNYNIVPSYYNHTQSCAWLAGYNRVVIEFEKYLILKEIKLKED